MLSLEVAWGTVWGKGCGSNATGTKGVAVSFQGSPIMSVNDSLQNERSGSQFSFTEIKRKLKNAIGRSKRDSRCLEKPVVDGSNGRSPPIRDQFYSERFSRIFDGFKIQVGAPRSFNFEAKSWENDGFGDRSD
ncbi:hypothetical protein LXL04_019965 [Taraxacum kok-saghyz]